MCASLLDDKNFTIQFFNLISNTNTDDIVSITTPFNEISIDTTDNFPLYAMVTAQFMNFPKLFSCLQFMCNEPFKAAKLRYKSSTEKHSP